MTRFKRGDTVLVEVERFLPMGDEPLIETRRGEVLEVLPFEAATEYLVKVSGRGMDHYQEEELRPTSERGSG